MADDTLNVDPTTDQNDFGHLAERYRANNFSYNGRDDDARQAITAYYREHPQTPVALAKAQVLEALGNDPDTAASVENYFTTKSVAFDDYVIKGKGTGDGSSTAQLDGAPPIPQSPSAGEPVDLATGQFVYSTVDISVSGAGIDFDFERTHRSGAHYLGPLGANWDHAYNLWLRVNSDETVSLTTGRLREVRYHQHQFFPYYVAIADDSIVVHTVDGAFEQQAPDGRVVRFEQIGDADGTIFRAVRINDRFRNTLQLAYDDQHRLSTVVVNQPGQVKPSRLVTFSYDEQSRIDSITLFPVTYTTEAGSALVRRKWIYAYDDFSDLVALTSPPTDEFPAGRTTKYAYSSPSTFAQRQHDMLSITDPNGSTYLENEYGSEQGTAAFGKVVRQRVGSGVFLFDYAQIIPDSSWDFSEANRPATFVTVIQRDGHPVRYVLNAMGNILAAQETIVDANEQRVVWRYAYDADGRRTATLSPEGRLTQIYYGREDFYRRRVSPGDESLPMWQDRNLSEAEHARFANLISTVQRSKKLTLTGLIDDLSIYGDVFPVVVNHVDSDDIIVKRSYENTFQQLATVSDPRYTSSPDPAAPESLDPNSPYSKHLTVITFNKDARATPAAIAITYPDTTYPAPLPNGTTGVKGAHKTFDGYDANGRLLQWTEPEGNVFAYAYFPSNVAQRTTQGFLKSFTAGVGMLDLVTGFSVNEAGQVVAVTDPLQNTTKFDIDPCGLTRKVKPPISGYEINYSYEGNAQVCAHTIAIINPDGSVAPGSPEITRFAYNEETSLVLMTFGDSSATPLRQVRRVYDASNRLIRLVKPRGNSICLEYDERSLLKQVTHGCCASEAATTSFGYGLDEVGVSVTDPRGFVTLTELDAFGRAIGITDPNGNLQRIDYDKSDNVVVERRFGALTNGTYPLLRRTEYLYDERGQLIRVRKAFFKNPIQTADPRGAPDTEFNLAVQNGEVQSYDTLLYLDGNLRLFRVVDANGNATIIDYDSANRHITTTDPAGNVLRSTYDAGSNLTRQDQYLVDTAGVTRAVISTVYEFDPLNRLKAIIDGAGNRLTLGLDSRGLLCRVTNALGRVSNHSYNAFRDPISVTDVLLPLGRGGVTTELTTTRSFDGNSNVTGITDPVGNKTTFEYDGLDRYTRAINPDGTSLVLGYDRSSNLTDMVDEGGAHASWTYDARDRLTSLAVVPPSLVPLSADLAAQFSYDGVGTLVRHTNAFLTVENSCDSLGRCYQEDLTFGTPLNVAVSPLTLTRQFDPVSNRIGLGYPSGQVLRYDFGPDNRFLALASLANARGYPGDKGAPANRFILRRKRWGDLAILDRFGNGVTRTPAYDAAGRRIADECTLPNGLHFLLQQLWDGSDNRSLTIEGNSSSLIGFRYFYDSTNRLLDSLPLANPQAVVTGPLAPPVAPLPINAFTCQQKIDKIVAGYGIIQPIPPQIQYDAVGNRVEQTTSQGNLVYTANIRNEYVSVGQTPFAYDRAGRLISDGKFDLAYNFRGQLIQAISQTSGKVALQVFHDAIGRPIGIIEGPKTRVLVMDGTNIVESYDDGILSALYLWEDRDRLCFFASLNKDQYVLRDVLDSTRLTSDSQGAVINTFRYDPFGNLTSGSTVPPFLYSGRYLYGSIGWYEYRMRQYIPNLGRFAQPDPAGFADGPNLYSFVGNNPLSAIDPTGMNLEQVTRAAVTETPGADPATKSLEEKMASWSVDYAKALTGTSGEARRKVHDYYKQQLHLLTHEAIHQGHIATLKFAGATYAAATAGAVGGVVGAEVGAGIATEYGLGTLGTNVLAHGLGGLTAAASTEATYLALGKPQASGRALVFGAAFGVVGGLAETGAHYYSFPLNSTEFRGMPGLIAPGKYGWQFDIKEEAGLIGPPIGSKQDPDIPAVSGLHRAHFQGYFIGGSNRTFYSSPRVNTSYMKVFENSASRWSQGGFLQVTTMRGGGVTSLEWSAYTTAGEAMRLGVPNVLDPSLPNLAPLLRNQQMSIRPGTTIWIER